MVHTLHVVSPQAWVGERIRAESRTDELRDHGQLRHLGDDAPWRIQLHDGLAPLHDFDEHSDALWISPGLLIALNEWRRLSGKPLSGKPQIMLETPPADWIDHLPDELLGRSVLVVPAKLINDWHMLPPNLGERPWSRIHNGRVDAFPAARRDLTHLQAALKGDGVAAPAPANSLIELSAHIPDIHAEWSVLIRDGQAVASSPYCIHQPAGSPRIITVFDHDVPHSRCSGEASPDAHAETRFDERHRAEALKVAQLAARSASIRTACMLVALREGRSEACVLEVDPVWCSSPLPYQHVEDRIDSCHLDGTEHGQSRVASHTSSGLGMFADAVIDASHPSRSSATYVSDPWMTRSFARRYASYVP